MQESKLEAPKNPELKWDARVQEVVLEAHYAARATVVAAGLISPPLRLQVCFCVEGFRDSGFCFNNPSDFSDSGFRVSGFSVLGFTVLGFQGFRVQFKDFSCATLGFIPLDLDPHALTIALS